MVTNHVKNVETLSRAQNASLLLASGVTDVSVPPVSDISRGRDSVVATPSVPKARSDTVGGGMAPTVLSEPDQESVSDQPLSVGVTTRTKEQRRPSRKLREAMANCFENEEMEDKFDEFDINTVDLTDPQTYAAAMKTTNAAQWQMAVDTELEALRENRTWIAVPRPTGVKPLHSKWVFKTKINADGSIERYKARLVACGNEQEKGVNYENTFAPVLDLATARWILAMGVIWGVPPRHGDIPNAYVRAEGEKEFKIYMHVPQGMKLTADEQASGGKNAVLQLMTSLYGLKQAGRLWNALLHDQMLKNGYKQCVTDLCLYFKRVEEDLIVVGVYVCGRSTYYRNQASPS